MSKTGRTNHRRGIRGRPKAERQISVRSVRRDPPDLRKLSRAVIAIALREAELDAQARTATAATQATSLEATTTAADEEVAND